MGTDFEAAGGLRPKDGTGSTTYAGQAADPSPAKTLIAVVEVPDSRQGTEKLDLTLHVRPREYPGQCPRFPAAVELIHMIYDYQVNAGGLESSFPLSNDITFFTYVIVKKWFPEPQ